MLSNYNIGVSFSEEILNLFYFHTVEYIESIFIEHFPFKHSLL